MSPDIDKLKGQLTNAALRGIEIEFQDGKKWMVRSIPLTLDNKHPLVLAMAKVQEGIGDPEVLLGVVREAVRLNYPDAKDEDINPDTDDFFGVMAQLTGTNSAKNFMGDLNQLKN